MLFAKSIVPEARRAYKLDAYAAILAGLFNGAIFPFVGFIARNYLKADVHLISLFVAAPYLGNIFSLFGAGAISNRNNMPWVIFSWILARGLFLFIVFAKTPITFAIIVSLSQFIATLSSPSYAAIMKSIYPDSQRGTIMGYCRIFLAFATIISTFTAGAIIHEWVSSYKIVMSLAAILGIISAIIFSRIPLTSMQDFKNSESMPSFILNTFKILKNNVRYRWFCISLIFYGVGGLILAPVIPIFQVDHLHITATQVSILSNVTQITWMISFFYWGPYVDRFSPLRAVFMNFLATTLVPANYLIAFFLPVNAWFLLPAFVFSGFIGAGVELSFFNTVFQISDPDQVAQYQGLTNFIMGIRGIFSPFIGATMLALGMEIWLIFAVSLFLLGISSVIQYCAMYKKTAPST